MPACGVGSGFSICTNCLQPLFPHQPDIMLCMLVIVLDFDCVAGRFGRLCER